MAELDLSPQIRELRSTFSDILHVSDLAKLKSEIEQLKQDAAAPDLWDDPAKAQKVTSALSHRQAKATKLEEAANRLDDLDVLIDMAKEARRIGLDGIMVMPALVYSSKPHETAAHFRSVASATVSARVSWAGVHSSPRSTRTGTGDVSHNSRCENDSG